MSDQSEIFQVIITEFIDAVRPQYVLVVAVAPFCGCLLTLLAILFAFSSPASRSLLVFKLNVIAILVALVTGILIGYINTLVLLEPFASGPTLSLSFTFAFFALCSPLFYDSILLLRVLAFYPTRSTPLRTLVKVLAVPILVKCGRLVCLSLFLHGYYVSSVENGPVTNWFRNPYVTSEWVLQVTDNMYSCGFFLYKLYIRGSAISKFGSGMLPTLTFTVLRSSDVILTVTFIRPYPSCSAMVHLIRNIFLISCANFVFPVLFNVAQIVLITADRSYLTITLLVLINGYVSVIGVLGATIWARAQSYTQEDKEGQPGTAARKRCSGCNCESTFSQTIPGLPTITSCGPYLSTHQDSLDFEKGVPEGIVVRTGTLSHIAASPRSGDIIYEDVFRAA
ncbi:hypothetical protein EDD16DRAFT_1781914 [Pisolithus croceorrhizus]|nr:hypothetical protein EDD16DRAFT_1781914 [Pisolithus croceorrhizus]